MSKPAKEPPNRYASSSTLKRGVHVPASVPGWSDQHIAECAKLCAGESRHTISSQPAVVQYSGMYWLLLTDDATAVMLSVPRAWAVKYDRQFDSPKLQEMMAVLGGRSFPVEAADLIDWCSIPSPKCPVCKGSGKCGVPMKWAPQVPKRHPALDSHHGRLGKALVDRRRLLAALRLMSASGSCLVGVHDSWIEVIGDEWVALVATLTEDHPDHAGTPKFALPPVKETGGSGQRRRRR